MRRRLATLPCLLVLAGCGLTHSSRPVDLYVSEITAPAQVAPAGPLHFTVTAQSGGCTSFDRLDVDQLSTRAILHARGTDTGGPGIACTADIRYNVVQVDLPGPFTDPFTIVAAQPDGSTLEKVIPVKP